MIFSTAVKYAESFYTETALVDDFTSLILDQKSFVSEKELVDNLFESLKNSISLEELFSFVTNKEWKKNLGETLAKPILEDITGETEKIKKFLKSSPDDISDPNYIDLLKIAFDSYRKQKNNILNLKKYLSKESFQYETVMDQYAQYILQCGINTYNSQKYPYKEIILKFFDLIDILDSFSVGFLIKERISDVRNSLNEDIDKVPSLVELSATENFVNLINQEKQKLEEAKNANEFCIDVLCDSLPKLISQYKYLKSNLSGNNIENRCYKFTYMILDLFSVYTKYDNELLQQYENDISTSLSNDDRIKIERMYVLLFSKSKNIISLLNDELDFSQTDREMLDNIQKFFNICYEVRNSRYKRLDQESKNEIKGKENLSGCAVVFFIVMIFFVIFVA